MTNLCRAEGGHCDSTIDDNVSARASNRLQQAVHAARHQHHDQEAGKAEAGRLLVHGPSPLLHLAVYRAVVPRRQSGDVRRRSDQSGRVADRRRRRGGTGGVDRLHAAQQSVVCPRCLHAAGM